MIVFHAGVEGVAYATILSQWISAILVLVILTREKSSYRLIWKDLHIHKGTAMSIFRIGFPAGLQIAVTSFSNVFVQSYINHFGSSCMAGWTTYGKLDKFCLLPIQSIGLAVTTFVGQNFGAGKLDRVYKGIRVCLGISAGATIFLSLLLYQFGQYIYLLFTTDAEVIAKGVEILHFLVPTLITYVCIEILSGALRGIGDCWIPMIMTALGVCLLRVVWIVVAVPLYPDIKTICFSYPLTWTVTSILFLVYFKWFSKIRKMKGIS